MGTDAGINMPTCIDLSHTIHDGLVIYKGLPAAIVCDFLTKACRNLMLAARFFKTFSTQRDRQR